MLDKLKAVNVKKSPQAITTSAPRTRSEKIILQKKREQARDRQRKRRANMSSKQKSKELEKQKDRYHQKKLAVTEQKKIPPKSYGRLLRQIIQKVKRNRDKASLCQLHFVKELLAGKTNIIRKKNLYKRTTARDTRIEDFYEQAGVNLPGKNTIKSMKLKKVLTKTVSSLFAEFKKKNPHYKISLATFSRRRPQHILISSSRAFRQCLCQHCVNPMLKAEKINTFLPRELKIQHVDDLVERTLCSTKIFERDCVDRTCNNCGVHLLSAALEGKLPDSQTIVAWLKWEKSERSPMDQVKKTGTLRDLLDELSKELESLAVHLKTARWQREIYQELIRSLPEDSAVVTVDFAENYLCKYQAEVQSAHWSYRQVSILPSVLHYRCNHETCSTVITDYVVALSDDLQHDAAFAKKTLDDVLQHLEKRGVKHIHIFSDGCASQFKSKLPFVHMTELSRDHPGLQIERHYFGSNHGKSLCDSCGGVVKGCATRAVVSGHYTIQSASDMHQYCCEQLVLPKPTEQIHEETHVRRSFLLYNKDQFMRSTKADEFVTLAGCRKIHNLKPMREVGELISRHLSCICRGCRNEDGQCENAQFVGKWKSDSILNKKVLSQRKLKQRESQQTSAPSATILPPASPPYLQEVPDQRMTENEMTRNGFFDQAQLALENATTFNELKDKCRALEDKLCKWQILCEVAGEVPPLDVSSLGLLPEEIIAQYFPVQVAADGNCLFRTLSFLATGTEEHHTEMRVRIIAEMALNEHMYTDADYLREASLFQGENILALLSLFAAVPFDQQLSANHPEEFFRREVMACRCRGVSCGLWQTIAAANLLQWNIQSIYPPLGELPIQQFMNRTVKPRAASNRTETIMWTSNRSDMVNNYWVANHVVPLLRVVQRGRDDE